MKLYRYPAIIQPTSSHCNFYLFNIIAYQMIINETVHSNGMITLTTKCTCGNTNKVIVKIVDYMEYKSNSLRHIKDIFPYLSASEREAIKTGLCDDCWEDMRDYDEEEDY